MKQAYVKKKNYITFSVIGMLAALFLVSSVVWAEKDDGKVDVKTDASSAVQSNSEEAHVPDYMDPIREMIQTQRELDQFFGLPFASFNIMPELTTAWDDEFIRPNMDLSEDAATYHVQMDLPGMDKSNIAVEVKDNVLTVKAESKKEIVKKDGEKVLMKERSSGFMSRALMLPKPVNAEGVVAEYQDGVLQITLPKVQADQAPQKIPVK